MPSMYEKASLDAMKLIRQGASPPQAWEQSVGHYTNSQSARTKGCPRGAFLGLCQEGLVKDVPAQRYTASMASKNYAISTVMLLKQGSTNVENINEIESFVMPERQRGDQGEIRIACVLWKNGLIR